MPQGGCSEPRAGQTSPDAFRTRLADLFALFGPRLSVSAAVRSEHAQSESLVSGPARAVVFPETTEEVAALAALADRHGFALTGWGAGTSLEGHALAVAGGVTVDFARWTVCWRFIQRT